MKHILLPAVLIALAQIALADIHDPPSNDYGPARKLGRGLSNFFLGQAEVTVSVATVNTKEGNSAAAGYGVVRGVWRSGARHVSGLIDILTWPFPIHGTYYPLLPHDTRYIHAGFSEFPPELGNESKHDYVRDY